MLSSSSCVKGSKEGPSAKGRRLFCPPTALPGFGNMRAGVVERQHLFRGMAPNVHSFVQHWGECSEELCFLMFTMKLPLCVNLIFRLNIA